MPIITIYRGASSGGEELADTVAHTLGYRSVGREALLRASERYGIPEAKLRRMIDEGPEWWDRVFSNIGHYRVALQAGFCELAASGEIVYHGHLGHQLAPRVRQVLRVLLTAPVEVRIRQVQAGANLSETEARRYIEDIDNARSRRLMAMFGTDWRDPAGYDLVLNLGHMSVASASHLVVAAAKLADYQPTAESEQQFKDISLTARAQAALIAAA